MAPVLTHAKGILAKRQQLNSLADDLSFHTHFNQEECLALLHTHENLNYRGKLDRGRFREFLYACLGISNDLMLDLTFRAFDRNADGTVDAMEFVTGLSQMIRGTMEELTEFCYFVYDMNGDRSLAREELHQCLKGCLQSGFGLEPEEIEDAEKDIVELAMRKLDHNRDGQITFEDFQNAVRGDPLLVISCGECLPADSCLARFMYTITEDYRSFTTCLIGTTAQKKMKRFSSAHSSRFFPQITDTATETDIRR